MTTTVKDITNLLEEKDVEFNPIRMDWLLGKFTHEELEDFLNLLKDIDNSTESFDRGYQEGYDVGQSNGYSEGYDACLEEQDE